MAGGKTEKATPQRLKKAREDGQFVVSRAMVGAVQFAVAIAMIGGLVSSWQSSLGRSLEQLIARSSAGEISQSEWPTLMRGIAISNLSPLVRFVGVLFAVTLATHLAITRFGFSVQRLTPTFGRLNPANKLKDLPRQNLRFAVQAILLLATLAAFTGSLVRENGNNFLRLPLEPVPTGSLEIGHSMSSLLWKAAALFFVFGAVDLVQAQRRHAAQLRMSKEEVREENKRTEGDPQMKARARRLRRDLLRRQMLRDVAKATAVVVNPTHYAVAVRYEMESMPCPIVVAKGKNWLALRMRQIATVEQIPIIENPPLARALYDAVDVGRAISPEFYKAIAEILAYVYRVMGRRLAS
jgi:flagellar biosynthetic protein FlhB